MTSGGFAARAQAAGDGNANEKAAAATNQGGNHGAGGKQGTAGQGGAQGGGK